MAVSESGLCPLRVGILKTCVLLRFEEINTDLR